MEKISSKLSAIKTKTIIALIHQHHYQVAHLRNLLEVLAQFDQRLSLDAKLTQIVCLMMMLIIQKISKPSR